MTRSSQEDLEERIFPRLDPGGELGTNVAVRKVDGQDYWFGLGEKSGVGRWLFAGEWEPPMDIADAAWSGPLEELSPEGAQADHG